MSIKQFTKDGFEISEIARGEETAMKHLLSTVRRRLEADRDDLEKNPSFDKVVLRNDMVFKLGLIAGLKWVISLPQDAKAFLKKIEKQEN